MRLIDVEKIMVPTSIIHNINGCYMVRVEDVQRIISDQPTAFEKEKVIDELKEEGCIIDNEAGNRAIEIVKKGGVEWA